MSLSRYAKRRDANEGDVIAALEAVGALVWQLDRPVDLLVGFRGRWVVLEVKDGRKVASARRLTDEQRQFLVLCEDKGLAAYEVTTEAEALRAIGVWAAT